MCEFYILGKLQHKYAKLYYMRYGSDSGLGEIGDAHCTRTTTRIRRHADTEHEKKDPKPRRQTNLCMLVYWFCCLWSAYVSASICVSLCARACDGLPTRRDIGLVYSGDLLLSRQLQT